MKSATAFRTISEVSADLDVPQHVLRFWETKFPQIRPLKRGGGRRYYRPEDVELLRRIQALLYQERYTIKGVQRLLREGRVADPTPPLPEDAEDESPCDVPGSPCEPASGVGEGGEASLPEPLRHEILMVIDELRSLRQVLDRACGRKDEATA
ncbi:MerR family transcriptional regulator [Azospirillum thermophilum]|nr:MerR family transcriptional regulator [Azospirillum thermophilum]